MFFTKSFFTKYLRPFLIIGGLVTMYAGIYAINPETALKDMNNLAYHSDYLFLIRHWGIMVGLMGFFITLSAFIEQWQAPIMLYSFLEKLFMIYLYCSNLFNPETAHLNAEFIPFVVTDITICTYTLGYWFERRQHSKPLKVNKNGAI